MNREIEERRQRADAAWSLIQADVVRLKEAVREEAAHLRSLGPRDVFEQFPLALAGVAAGAGFLLGFRGARHRAIRALLERGASSEASPARVTLGRKIVEAIVLAAVQRGAAALATSAAHRTPARPSPAHEESGRRSGGV